MSAQKIATAVGLAALAALLVSIGLPAILPPGPVPEIEVVVPVGDPEETEEPVVTPRTSRPARDDDDRDDDRDDDQDDAGDDGPGDSPDDSPDDDDGDDDD